MMKCTKCNTEKARTDFYADASRGTGLSSSCKVCYRARVREYYYANKTAKLEYAKQKYETNKPIIKERMKKWRKNNPEKCRLLSLRKEARRRARLRGNEVAHYNREDIYKEHDGLCYLCGYAINLKLKTPHPLSFTIDHIVPIYFGGGDTPENVAPAHSSCNSRKGIKQVDKLGVLF